MIRVQRTENGTNSLGKDVRILYPLSFPPRPLLVVCFCLLCAAAEQTQASKQLITKSPRARTTRSPGGTTGSTRTSTASSTQLSEATPKDRGRGIAAGPTMDTLRRSFRRKKGGGPSSAAGTLAAARRASAAAAVSTSPMHSGSPLLGETSLCFQVTVSDVALEFR